LGRFIKGDIVVVPFPFSDLSQSKRRPALVLADLEGDDLILSQITSQNLYDSYSMSLLEDDFYEGTLNRQSNIRPNKIFTADENIVLYKAAHIKNEKMDEVTKRIIDIFSKE
jgi:mRNA interferase MazF